MPNPTAPEKGHVLEAEILSIRGTCNAGHQVGDRFEVSARDTAGMCGYLYHAAHPAILMLQFGGNPPWGRPGEVVLECPDRENRLTLKLTRKGRSQ